MKQRGQTLPKKRATMKTIAKEAGVTLSTVSRILNKAGGKYAEDTKEKIFEIAERLKYRPNALVLGMQSGKTHTAGVMVPAGGFYGDIVCGIHEELVDHHTIMLLGWNTRTLNKENEPLERQIIHQMIDRRVDGILLRPSSEDFESSYFEEIWERDIPLILIDREMSKMKTDFVGTDDHRGGWEAAEYLLSLGHRRMLFVGIGVTASTSRHREAGFCERLHRVPEARSQSLIVSPAIAEEVCQRLRSSEKPTAIFCYNDDVAHRVAKALRAGTVYVNCYDADDITVPFGGFKQSGNGRDKSLHAMDKYTELKTTWIDLSK